MWNVIRRRALALSVLGALLGGPALAQSTMAPPPPEGLKVATFAAGCFWCVEPPFDKLDGVVSTTSGYAQGGTVNPTYRQVASGATGHVEAVRVVYDPAKVSYEKLLEVFWRNVDPLDAGGQFCDRGSPYRPGIYTHDDEQRRAAEDSKATLAASKRFDRPIAVEIEPARDFYVAEDYHQDYATKNPSKYAYYRWGCGRDRRLQELWGAPGS
jgi:peptide-methionine (S)-S-oxide reductase